MTSKTTNKFSPEVRTRAVRMVLEHEGEHASRWAAVVSISSKIGCTPQTLHEWVKKAEIDSGKRSGVPSDVSDRLKALERENRELRQLVGVADAADHGAEHGQDFGVGHERVVVRNYRHEAGLPSL